MNQKFEGYTNSATFSAAITLENDRSAYEEFSKLWIMGQLTAGAIKSTFDKLGYDLGEWVEGKVNWDELVADYDIKYQEDHLYQPVVQLDALTVLSGSVIENNIVKLTTGQLDRKLYEKVSSILEALGGKWNKKVRGHVFKLDPTEQLEDVLLTGKVKKPEKYGFFPTPPELAKEVINLAGLKPGHLILEPEAGSAGLADYAAELVGKENVYCCELQAENVQLLESKGYQTLKTDFIKVTPAPVFDSVVMNPPFERQQDITHVLHAWEFVKPGGSLTSIMSASVTFRSDRKSTEFKAFLDEHGHLITNPEGSFKPSGTNINTITVVLHKPAGILMAPEKVAEYLAGTFGKTDAPLPMLLTIPAENPYGQYALF